MSRRGQLGDEIVLVLAATLKRIGRPVSVHSIRVAFSKTYGINGSVNFGDAVRHLRGTGRLIEDREEGTWGPGQDFAPLILEGWPEEEAQRVCDNLPEKETKASPLWGGISKKDPHESP